MKLKVMGHWLFCRECEKPDVKGEDGETVIVLTDKYRKGYLDTGEETKWLEVLAKGPQVGTARDWPHYKLREYKCPRHLEDCYEIGDLILVPGRHPWGIKHSPFNDCDFFIDESVPICAWREPPKE